MIVVYTVETLIMGHTIAAMVSDYSVATITLDKVVATDIIVAFIIPLIALLISSPVLWHTEHSSNFCVFQRVHHSNLIFLFPYFVEVCWWQGSKST
jgi:hypothetical protein